MQLTHVGMKRRDAMGAEKKAAKTALKPATVQLPFQRGGRIGFVRVLRALTDFN
jgi:hypothetical protein